MGGEYYGEEPAFRVGDASSISGPGRSHMPWGNQGYAPYAPLSPCSRAFKRQLLKPESLEPTLHKSSP